MTLERYKSQVSFLKCGIQRAQELVSCLHTKHFNYQLRLEGVSVLPTCPRSVQNVHWNFAPYMYLSVEGFYQNESKSNARLHCRAVWQSLIFKTLQHTSSEYCLYVHESRFLDWVQCDCPGICHSFWWCHKGLLGKDGGSVPIQACQCPIGCEGREHRGRGVRQGTAVEPDRVTGAGPT